MKNVFKLKKDKHETVKVAIEIGKASLNIAELSVSKEKKTFRLMQKAIAPDQEISAVISQAFTEYNIRTKTVLLNIPRHNVIARFLRLPSTNDNEIRNIVAIESMKQMPYSNDEVTVRHKVENKFEDGYSSVLMVIAQAEEIKKYVDMVKAAGLAVEKIALSAESLFEWYKFIAREDRAPITAIIDIASDYVDIDIVNQAHLVFTRSFSYDTKAKLFKNKIADEIAKSIALYQKENASTVGEIIISGAENTLRDVEAILRKEVNAQLSIVPQLQNVEIGQGEGAYLGEESFVDLVGLAARGEEIRINMMPQELIDENRLRSIKKYVAVTLALSVAIAAAFIVIAAGKIVYKTNYLASLESEIDDMEPDVTRAKRIKEDIDIIKQEVHKKPLAIDILTEVYSLVPSGINLNLLDYDSSKTLIMRGAAPSSNEVISLIRKLEDSRYFENAKVKYMTKRSGANSRQTDFELTCSLSKIS